MTDPLEKRIKKDEMTCKTSDSAFTKDQTKSFSDSALTQTLVSPLLLTPITLELFNPLDNELVSPITKSNKPSEENRYSTSEEKRQNRLWRNRLAAKECRKKKKAYIEELEIKKKGLEEQNDSLCKEVTELRRTLSFLTQSTNTHSIIKQVGSLSVNLTLSEKKKS